VEITSSGDRRYSLLKNNALAQAAEACAHNVNAGSDGVRLFEWTRFFRLLPDGSDSLCEEVGTLWAVAAGLPDRASWDGQRREVPVHEMISVLADIAEVCQHPLELAPLPEGHPLRFALHPYRSKAITDADGAYAGVIGEMHPDLRERFQIGSWRPVYLELSANGLAFGSATQPVDPPLRAPSHRMLDFVMPVGLEAGAVLKALQEAGPAELMNVEPVDVYAGSSLPEGTRSITYLLSFRNDALRR